MASTYYLIKSLQNADSRIVNWKRNKQPDINKIKYLPSVSQKCRVCLQHGDIPIFSKTDCSTCPVSNNLKLICDIDITFNDKYPKHLCKSCFDTLNAAVQLRITAKKTQSTLKKLHSSHQNINNSYKPDYKILESDIPIEYKPDVPILTPAQEEESKKAKELSKSTLAINCDSNPPQKVIKKMIQYEKYYKQILTDDNKPVYQCLICKKNYKKLSIADHLITHLPDSVSQYVCEVCGKTFKKYCVFHQHRAVHSNILPFKCKLCPYKGRRKQLLQGHIKRVHNKEYNYQCTQCPKKFKDSGHLKHHLRRHGEPMFHCDFCQKPFYEKRELQQHIESQHMGDTALHQCDICGNSYKRRKNLLVHQIKTHKRKKVYNNRATYLQLDQLEKTN